MFSDCGKEDFTQEGQKTFKAFIHDKTRINRLIFYGCFIRDELAGIIALNNQGTHISLLFVRPEYHRKGIGKALFKFAVKNHPTIEITVNSSTYAIPFYKKIGFTTSGDKQGYHGLYSTPMRRYHAIITQKTFYTLRTWQWKDAPALASYLNNKKIWDNCRDDLPHPYTLTDAETFIDIVKKKEGIHDFCIEIDGKVAGNISFSPGTDIERFNAEAGYVISEAIGTKVL